MSRVEGVATVESVVTDRSAIPLKNVFFPARHGRGALLRRAGSLLAGSTGS